MSNPATISPTAHYTAAVWGGAGLSHPALVTPEGRVLVQALRPLMAATGALGGPRLRDFLLARHRIIDHLLVGAIEDGRVGQVIEIAAGMSPRGWSLHQRFGDRLTYVEADLPGMAARKREALAAAGSLGAHHRVAELDALSDNGPLSLPAVAASLDPARGVAIVTEGLLNYLDRGAVLGLWQRIAEVLAGFPSGLYLSDLHLADEAGGVVPRAFMAALSVFVLGRVHLHFDDEADASAALSAAGLAATLHRPPAFAGRLEGCGEPGARLVRVIEAQPAR